MCVCVCLYLRSRFQSGLNGMAILDKIINFSRRKKCTYFFRARVFELTAGPRCINLCSSVIRKRCMQQRSATMLYANEREDGVVIYEQIDIVPVSRSQVVGRQNKWYARRGKNLSQFAIFYGFLADEIRLIAPAQTLDTSLVSATFIRAIKFGFAKTRRRPLRSFPR